MRHDCPSPAELLQRYRSVFEERIATGTIKPFIFPYHAITPSIVILYLSIPHRDRPWLYAARWLVVAFVLSWEVTAVRESSSVNMAVAEGMGLIASWTAARAVELLLLTRPQWEAKRVERRYRHKSAEYFWQSYPHALLDRLSWSVDLYINVRGAGWHHAIRVLPPLPAAVQAGLGRTATRRTGIRRYSSRRDLLRRVLPAFVAGYLALDAMKVLAMQDPYFVLGPNRCVLPPHLAGQHPLLRHAYRQVLSLCLIIVSLQMLFMLGTLLLVAMGPAWLGLRGEPWMFAEIWGSPLAVLRKGLRGFWSEWWHQTFRSLFASPTTWLVRHGVVSARGPARQLLDLFFAFGISGVLHACGSLTLFPDSRPLEPLCFFLTQAVGILVQITLSPAFKHLAKPIRRLGNLLFTVLWLLLTSWLLIDDLSRGGVWLYEPIPISLLGLLGYRDWWCWNPIGVGWYTGKHWDSGISM